VRTLLYTFSGGSGKYKLLNKENSQVFTFQGMPTGPEVS